MQPLTTIVRRGQLPAIVGLSLATIDRLRLRLNGDFPEARKLSEQSIGWLRADIDAWLASRPLVRH